MGNVPLNQAIKRAYTGRARQEDIATALGVAQPTVSRWARGEVEPSFDQLAALEDHVDRPRGFVLMAAGFVARSLTVEDAILADPQIDDRDRDSLLALYHSMIERGGGE